jgi:hypothetical protein
MPSKHWVQKRGKIAMNRYMDSLIPRRPYIRDFLDAVMEWGVPELVQPLMRTWPTLLTTPKGTSLVDFNEDGSRSILISDLECYLVLQWAYGKIEVAYLS